MTLLFADLYVLVFTPDEWRLLLRPIHGDGGAQGLLRKLLAAETESHVVTVDYRVLDKSYQYAYRYANGGFQDRFRAVVKAGLRAGWEPQDVGVSQRTRGAFGRAR